MDTGASDMALPTLMGAAAILAPGMEFLAVSNFPLSRFASESNRIDRSAA